MNPKVVTQGNPVIGAVVPDVKGRGSQLRDHTGLSVPFVRPPPAMAMASGLLWPRATGQNWFAGELVDLGEGGGEDQTSAGEVRMDFRESSLLSTPLYLSGIKWAVFSWCLLCYICQIL